jgi:hypothetical protein
MGPKKARVPAEGSSGGCLLRGLMHQHMAKMPSLDVNFGLKILL